MIATHAENLTNISCILHTKKLFISSLKITLR